MSKRRPTSLACCSLHTAFVGAHRLFILLLLAAPVTLVAQHPFGIQTVPDTLELSEVHRATLGLSIRSSGEAFEGFSDRLKVPEGWRIVPPPVGCTAGRECVRLFLVTVPRNQPAGVYAAQYTLMHDATTVDSATVHFVVPVRISGRLTKAIAPQYLVEGRQTDLVFRIQNPGNAPLAARLEIDPVAGLTVQPDRGSVFLEPGMDQEMGLRVVLSPAHHASDRCTLHLRLIPETGAPLQISHSMQILELNRTQKLVYHELPLELGFGAGAFRGYGGTGSGFLSAGARGSGSVLEEAPTRYSLDVYVPSASEQMFSQYDRYLARIETDNIQLGVGDISVATPGLFGYSVYGLGADATARFRSLTIKGYGTRERRNRLFGERHYGGEMRLDVVPLVSVGAAAINRDSYIRSGSAAAGILAVRPIKGVEAEGWYGVAVGEEPSAAGYSARLDIQRGVFGSNLEMVHTDPTFPGTYNGTDYARGYASLNLPQRNRLFATLSRHGSRNDTLDGRGDWINLNGSIRFSHGSWLSVQATTYEASTDGRSGKTSLRRTVRTTLTPSVGSLNLNAGLELGYLSSDKDVSSRVAGFFLGASLKLTSSLSASVAGSVTEGAMIQFGAPQKSQTWSGSGSLNYRTDLTRARFSAYTSRMTGRFPWHTTSMLADIERTLPWKHRLAVTAEARLFSGTTIGQVALRYVVPLHIRTRPSRKSGLLRGRVYDSETGGGLANQLLFIQGRGVLTAADGTFAMSAVKPGTLHLGLSDFDHGIVVKDSTSLRPVIYGGAVTNIEVPVLRPGTLVVRLTVVDSAGTVIGPAPDVDVAVSGENTRMTLRSTPDGSLVFGRLAPGKYFVSVDRAATSANYTPVHDATEVVITSAGTTEVVVQLRERVRRIRFNDGSGKTVTLRQRSATLSKKID